MFNEGNTFFGCYDCENLTTNEIEIRRHIIDGGGYFLQVGSDINTLLSRVEFSELYGLDFEVLQKNLDAAIDNLEKARGNYYQLKNLAAVTPYNQDMIDRLIKFNYDDFKEGNGLIPAVFESVKMYLKNGDLRGIYNEFYHNSGEILDTLYTLNKNVDAGIFPKISTLWSLNHKYVESKLFGLYAAMIFIEVK
jgi:hypothetical protein